MFELQTILAISRHMNIVTSILSPHFLPKTFQNDPCAQVGPKTKKLMAELGTPRLQPRIQNEILLLAPLSL